MKGNVTARLDCAARLAEGVLDYGVGIWNPDAGLGHHRGIGNVPQKVMAGHRDFVLDVAPRKGAFVIIEATGNKQGSR
jgi:hypothetical protein